MILPASASEKTLPLPAEYINQLKNTEQNPRYHAEGNVYNHTLLVLKQFEKGGEKFDLSDQDQLILYWAAVLHDIGKPVVTHWREGRWRATGHEEAGVPIARNLLLQNPEIDYPVRRKILDLVNFHQIPLRWGLAKKDISDYKKLATKTDIRLLGIFAYFDLMGRICEDHDRIYALITHFNEEIVPQIHYETGRCEDIQETFNQAGIQRKNALWESLKLKDIKLMEKLLEPKGKDTQPAVFQCYLAIGASENSQKTYLETHFPETPTFSVPALSSEILSSHERELQLRQVKHFLSVNGRAGKTICITGANTVEAVRQNLSGFIRLLGGQINYLFFDQTIDQVLLASDENGETEAQIRGNYNRLRYPHPWESHTLTVV